MASPSVRPSALRGPTEKPQHAPRHRDHLQGAALSGHAWRGTSLSMRDRQPALLENRSMNSAGILPAVYRSHPCLTYVNVFGACSCPYKESHFSPGERGDEAETARLRRLSSDKGLFGKTRNGGRRVGQTIKLTAPNRPSSRLLCRSPGRVGSAAGVAPAASSTARRDARRGSGPAFHAAR
jgi:hypothetical protein